MWVESHRITSPEVGGFLYKTKIMDVGFIMGAGVILLMVFGWLFISFNAKRVARKRFAEESKALNDDKLIENFNSMNIKVLHDILYNIRDHQSYYVAGTLCVDDVLEEDVLMYNLDGEILSFGSGASRRMTKEMLDKAFEIYEEVKGETQYLEECRENLETNKEKLLS